MTARNRSRYGSDEARSWVRSLRLGNSYAKCILLALANYVNDDGTAYPGIDTLHQDTEIAENTITARLRWCEAIGAVILSKCWIDENGNRNKQGRGRPTSLEVRLLFDADVAAIEAAAKDNSAERAPRGWRKKQLESAEISSAPHAEQTENSSPSLAPQQLLNSSAPHADESESESRTLSPNPFPEKAGKGAFGKNLEDPKTEQRWAEFRASPYPDGIIDVEAARREFGKLPESDQADAIRGVPLYADRLRKRRDKSKAAHLYLRKKIWLGLLATASPATVALAATNHAPASPAGRALAALARIARYNLFRLSDGSIPYQGALTPLLLAFAQAPPEADWAVYPRGSQNYAAWRRLLDDVFAGRPLPALPAIEAPWPFPPRRDGTVATTGPPAPSIAEQDAEWLAENTL